MADEDIYGAEWLARVRDALDILGTFGADWHLLDRLPPADRERLHRVLAGLGTPSAAERRRNARSRARTEKAARIERAERKLRETGIRVLRRKRVFTTPNVLPPTSVDGAAAFAAAGEDHDSPTADEERKCYVCKNPYEQVHHFYDQLCPSCAALNFAKRTELADLSGRVALITGGRVKIGYQAGLKLLRSGASLIVTSRFPRDTARRYAGEPDFLEWRDRLEVVGLDLRHTPSVEAFCRHLLATRSRLDAILNNACQTVRRPPQFYRHMMALERASEADLPRHVRQLVRTVEVEVAPVASGAASTAGVGLAPASLLHGLSRAAELSQVALLSEDHAGTQLFPPGALDQDLQQVDLRGRNSWRLLLDEVSAVELLEVQLVNAVAPFIINARLKALMMRTPNRDKHIVNVSAMEGQFYRLFKTTRHPHTNMAKAALNMLTRTAAADYYQDGIHMNSVDTGWVTDEDPEAIAQRKTQEQRFHPPLDIVDGAARIVDPVIDGLNTGVHVWGQFLKDYRPTAW